MDLNELDPTGHLAGTTDESRGSGSSHRGGGPEASSAKSGTVARGYCGDSTPSQVISSYEQPLVPRKQIQ